MDGVLVENDPFLTLGYVPDDPASCRTVETPQLAVPPATEAMAAHDTKRRLAANERTAGRVGPDDT